MVSTYGLAIVAEQPSVADAEQLAEQIIATLSKQWASIGEPNPATEVGWEVDDEDGRGVLLMNGPGVVADRMEADFFTTAGEGRAVICEDGDEYGVVFQVWKLSPSGSECVYRTYVQDPELDPEPATAARAILGAEAAAAAASLYGVDADALLAIEGDPSAVIEELGVIGSPFMPWLEAFGLDWPEV